MSQFMFGGDWTEQKLSVLRKYLKAYARIMASQSKKYPADPFRFAYIDAFAGTGYRVLRQEEFADKLLFPELLENEPRAFLDGSARIALQVEPQFDSYIFIEKDEKRYTELLKLKEQFPTLSNRIRVMNDDANTYLINLCTNYTWKRNRAVLFLDPFGMQVTWETVQAIALTKAIDMWYLFPLGIGVNRLLKKDGQISDRWKERLDLVFGERGWYNVFYQTTTETNLFGEETLITKVGDFDAISAYFVKRLKSAFQHVAEKPKLLYNSRNNPLFLLCFASAKEKAVEIAGDILDNI